MQKALDALRAHGEAVDLSELVVLGAQSKLAALDQDQHDQVERRRLREQFLRLTASGSAFDLDAAVEVREHGWGRD